MERLGYVVYGFAPALFWLWFLRSKDRLEPEPRSLVLRVFVLGALTPFLVLSIRPTLESLLPHEPGPTRVLLDAFLVTALCEELVKAGAMSLGILFHREFDEPLDGIVYGGAAALGFASIENVAFLLAYAETSFVVGRGFTATLVHLACTGTLGFFVAHARLSHGRGRIECAAVGLLLAVLMHGVYDAFLFSGEMAGRFGIAVVVPALVVAFGVLLRRAMLDSARRAVAQARVERVGG
jgi:RsiW-degrading membrane proteinase PrsW (M82 family)